MATIIMPASKVAEACQKVIEHIESKRAIRDFDRISDVMSVQRGFFKKYHFTREQAIQHLDKSDFFGWKSCYGWGDLEHANKLLKLALYGDQVTLNEEDIRVLF